MADSDGDDYDSGGGYGWDAGELDLGNEAADLIEAPHLVGKLVINYSRASKQVRPSAVLRVSALLARAMAPGRPSAGNKSLRQRARKCKRHSF